MKAFFTPQMKAWNQGRLPGTKTASVPMYRILAAQLRCASFMLAQLPNNPHN
jgi:hypothetical protein